MHNSGHFSLPQLLEHSLSSDEGYRSQANEKLEQYLAVSGFGVELTSFLVQQTDEPQVQSLQRLAGVLLKKLIKMYWESSFVDGGSSVDSKTYIVPEAEKQHIRHVLSQALIVHTSSPQLQKMICMAISSIASIDWPEQWPELWPQLMELLSSASGLVPQQVGIHCIALMVDGFNTSHIAEIIPILFPKLQAIFITPGLPTRLQMKIVSIMSTCVSVAIPLAQAQENNVQQVLHAQLATWIPTLCSALQVGSNFALHIDIVRFFKTLVMDYLEALELYWPRVLPPMWQLVSQSVTQIQGQVQHHEGALDELELAYDSDGESRNFNTFTCELLEFIQCCFQQMSSTKSLRVQLTPVMSELVYLLIGFLPLSRDVVENVWTSEELSTMCLMDEFQSIMDDHGDVSFEINALGSEYTVRQAAMECLGEISTFGDRKSVQSSVRRALARRLEECTRSSSRSDGCWQMHEATLTAIGHLSPLLLMKKPKQNEKSFDTLEFIPYLVRDFQSQRHHNLVKVRVLWCLCQFITSKAMSSANIQFAVEQSSDGILTHTTTTVVVNQNRPALVVSCQSLMKIIKSSKQRALAMLHAELVSKLMQHLLSFTESTNDRGSLSNDPHLIQLVLETLSALVRLHPQVTLHWCPSMVQSCQRHLVQFVHNPVLNALILEIFQQLLCLSPECGAIVERDLLPTLAQVLTHTLSTSTSGILESSIEILIFLLYFTTSTQGTTVPPRYVDLALAPVLHLLLVSDDPAVLQLGVECCRVFLQKTPQLCLSRSFEMNLNEQSPPPARSLAGQTTATAVEWMLHVASRMLSDDADLPDVALQTVGSLVSQLVSQLALNHLELETVTNLLLAVVSRIRSVDNPAVLQSLVSVFARLVHGFGVESVVQVLVDFNALEDVMSKWCQWQPEFYGVYEVKITLLALSKLFVVCCSQSGAALAQVMVWGDSIVIPQDSHARVTRAQQRRERQGDSYQRMIFPHRAIQLFIRALGELENDQGEEEEGEWEDSDSSCSSSSSGEESSEESESSEWILNRHMMQHQDFQAAEDPLSQVDLAQHFRTLLTECYQHQPEIVNTVVSTYPLEARTRHTLESLLFQK